VCEVCVSARPLWCPKLPLQTLSFAITWVSPAWGTTDDLNCAFGMVWKLWAPGECVGCVSQWPIKGSRSSIQPSDICPAIDIGKRRGHGVMQLEIKVETYLLHKKTILQLASFKQSCKGRVLLT
jgi:hypothetical protein